MCSHDPDYLPGGESGRNSMASGCPGPSSQHIRDFPQRDRGQEIRDKDRRWRIREKGKGMREWVRGYLSWEGGDKGLLLDRRKTDMTHRKMRFIKVKGEVPC